MRQGLRLDVRKIIGWLVMLGQTPREQHTSAAGQNELTVIEFIRDRRTCNLPSGTGVPQSLAVAGVESEGSATRVACECQPRIRR